MANISTVKCYSAICYGEMFEYVKYFSLRIQSLWTQSIDVCLGLIDSNNYEDQRSNVLKYPSDYLLQPPRKPIHYG